MSISQNIQKSDSCLIQIKKALAQGGHSNELLKQIDEKIQYIDISRGSSSGDLVIMDCFAPLPGKLSLLVSPDLPKEELLSFFVDVQRMLHSLLLSEFKQGYDIFPEDSSPDMGVIYHGCRDLEYIE